MDLLNTDSKVFCGKKMIEISNVILIKDGNILLGLRSNHKPTYPNCWALPGGHIELMETPVQTARRELVEELDITVLELTELKPIKINQGNRPTVFHLFKSQNWDGDIKLNNPEHSRLKWFTFDDAFTLERLALDEYRPYFHGLKSKPNLR